MRAVLLYGPPAGGKDTITATLAVMDERYVLYERLKVGGRRTDGYRIVDAGYLATLRRDGRLLWENSRYGAVYAVERTSLVDLLADSIPVIHVGQPEGIDAITAALPYVQWFRVYLWCPRDIAAERLSARSLDDLDERLQAWDATPSLVSADLTFNTAVVSTTHVASAIRSCVGL